MEALNVAMKEARSAGVFQGLNQPHNGPPISYFLYVDDVLFLGSWSYSNAFNLMRILRVLILHRG